MSESIHPTSLVHAEARVGAGVQIGPFCVVEDGVELGDGVTLASHVVIRRGTRLGAGVKVDSFAVLGGLPQDLRFNPDTPSGVVVGERTVIREGVTIHRATVAGSDTVVGADCLLMAQVHLAHDVRVESRAVLANNVLLGGHVRIGAGAFIGGGAAVHQNTRVGGGAMVGGLAVVTLDIPPRALAADRNHLAGLNVVGLKRSGLPRADIVELKLCWNRVYSGGSPQARAGEALREGMGTTETGRTFLEFFQEGKRGFARPGKRGSED